jgi:hypothetical protein
MGEDELDSGLAVGGVRFLDTTKAITSRTSLLENS